MIIGEVNNMAEDKQQLEVFEEGESKLSGSVGFETIVMFQLNRINQVMSRLKEWRGEHMQPSSEVGETNFIWAIRALHSLLSPYFDEQFKNEYKTLRGSEDSGFMDAVKEYALLTQLLDRQNLLLQKSMKERARGL